MEVTAGPGRAATTRGLWPSCLPSAAPRYLQEDRYVLKSLYHSFCIFCSTQTPKWIACRQTGGRNSRLSSLISLAHCTHHLCKRVGSRGEGAPPYAACDCPMVSKPTTLLSLCQRVDLRQSNNDVRFASFSPIGCCLRGESSNLSPFFNCPWRLRC